MLILTLTPREATAVADELLDPGNFPWQGSESQLIALDVRHSLMLAVKNETAFNLAATASMIPPPEEAVRIKAQEEKRCCENCGGVDTFEEQPVVGREHLVTRICVNCNYKWRVRVGEAKPS